MDEGVPGRPIAEAKIMNEQDDDPRARAFRLPHGPPVGRRLDNLGRESLRAVVVGVAALWEQLPLAVRHRIPPDLAARDEPATMALAALIRRLAAALVRDTVRGAEGDGLKDAYAKLATALDAIPGLTPEDVKRHLEEAAPATGELLREIGLDELDVDIAFDDPPGAGGLQGLWVPLTPRACDAALVPRALDRLMAWAVRDPLAQLEIAAAQWAFAAFGGPRGEGQPQAALARMTRELEWLVLDRPALAFGGTVAQAFLASTRRDDPSPRLRGLVRSLARSFAGVFSVRRRRAGEAELERLEGKGQYRMIEHNDHLEYGPRDFALGRLIPVESARYLRSPGMVIWRAEDAGASRMWGERSEEFMARGLDAALAVEAMLRTLTGAAVVPDHGPVAASAEEAGYRLDLFWQRVRAAGVGIVLPPEATEATRPPGALGTEEGETLEARAMNVDPSLYTWLQKLAEMAGRR